MRPSLQSTVKKEPDLDCDNDVEAGVSLPCVPIQCLEAVESSAYRMNTGKTRDNGPSDTHTRYNTVPDCPCQRCNCLPLSVPVWRQEADI
jgi:hypothetical protein